MNNQLSCFSCLSRLKNIRVHSWLQIERFRFLEQQALSMYGACNGKETTNGHEYTAAGKVPATELLSVKCGGTS